MRPANAIFMQRTAYWLLNRFISSSVGLVPSSRNAPARSFCAVLRTDTARLCAINTGLTPSSGCQVPRGILTAEALVCRSRSEVPRTQPRGQARQYPVRCYHPSSEQKILAAHFKFHCYIPWTAVSEAADAIPVWLCRLRFGRGMCPHKKLVV